MQVCNVSSLNTFLNKNTTEKGLLLVLRRAQHAIENVNQRSLYKHGFASLLFITPLYMRKTQDWLKGQN